jgi:hypothetical protein
LGLLIGFVEGWSVGDAIYFTFITGLTIGYGDIVPRQALARALAIGIGVSALFLTGVIAAIAVHAMRVALSDGDTSWRHWAGRDGMTGISVVLGNGDRLPHEVYMQIAGSLPAGQLCEAIAKSSAPDAAFLTQTQR